MKKRNLATLLGIPILAIALTGCPQNYDSEKAQKNKVSFEYSWISKESTDILDNYKYLKERKIKENDKYLKYAKELQKNPKLRDVRADTIAGYLRMINDGKDLIAREYTKFPIY